MHQEPFIAFKSAVSHLVVPEQFPYLYTYEPHPLCRIAADELQEKICRNPEWNKRFGLEGEQGGVGKMFGVLVVQQQEGTLGYLAGFSGAIAGSNNYPGFVPPVFDLLNPKGFFKQGEIKLNEINAAIEQLENSNGLQTAKNQLNLATEALEQLQTDWKARMKAGKKERKRQRHEAAESLEGEALEDCFEELNRASQLEKMAYKKAMAEQKREVELAQKIWTSLLEPLEALKEQRKVKSAQLQFEIFDQFRLLNDKAEVKTVPEIFRELGEDTPPAGAGDCAGPKLLQFAFQQKLKPIAMAEFWWGASPKSEIRKHKQFYPPCRSKCAPIMQHMLKHLDMETDPLHGEIYQPRELEMIFEDDWLMVVNKPEQFLSVPGKEITDSVLQRIKQMRPEAEGPLLVHRLDMSTSGILLVAKDQLTHKALQSQFIKRTTRKRYVAILDGLVQEDRGVIDLPIRVDLDNRPRQLVCYEHGKSARTKWEVISRENGKTRIHFYPVTGRTHQLRVHAAHPNGLNTPIMGDELYGIAADRLYLHAEYIGIIHPQSGAKMEFTIPAPF
ncbi:RluA family pseudouridine synthase [Mangrovibacterium lignilyticum]|uniref:RluA family pseudouridine synthase n=1 Tax=Mangrovibacterium lignilyticum TaxID=2668052 RepID=UPI0013D7F6AD|nr:RluA family pseudouridine synthase [Mangrovibacterium lignilyticum]